MTTTEANDLLFEPVATTIKRDRWGRYRLPDPITGKERSWTRATTLAGTLADRFGLEQWSKRNVALGIGARADLYAQAASCTPEDKATLNAIVAQAEEASKAHSGANLGTALHRFTERLDAGEDVSPPAPWDADVAAYRATMQAHGVAVMGEWIERVLLIPELGVAGTCDRLCRAAEWAQPRIGDLKTGKDVLRYSMPEIAIQLALYAHATHWWDPSRGCLQEIDIPIDADRAIVMHLPVGEARCSLYEVDIAAGWAMAQTAVGVREWRKRKDLASQLTPLANAQVTEQPDGYLVPTTTERSVVDVQINWDALNATGGATRSTPATAPAEPTPSGGSGGVVDQGAPEVAEEEGDPEVAEGVPAMSADELHAARLAWLQKRINAIKAKGDEATAALAREWSTNDAIPTMPNGGPRTAEEVEVVSGWCWAVEGAFGIKFPDPEPGSEAFIAAARRAGLISADA